MGAEGGLNPCRPRDVRLRREACREEKTEDRTQLPGLPGPPPERSYPYGAPEHSIKFTPDRAPGVERKGIEPSTSALRTRHSPN